MAAPFAFVEDGSTLLDPANGIVISLYQWPEFNVTICVQPVAGPQAEAWPVSSRAWFELGIDERYATDAPRTVSMTYAMAHVPFGPAFPGRIEELLDQVLPLILPYYVRRWPAHPDTVIAPLPLRLRECLAAKGSYFDFRDREPPGADTRRRERGRGLLGWLGLRV